MKLSVLFRNHLVVKFVLVLSKLEERDEIIKSLLETDFCLWKYFEICNTPLTSMHHTKSRGSSICLEFLLSCGCPHKTVYVLHTTTTLVHSHTYLLHKINEAALKVTLTRPSFKPVCTVHVKVYQFWLGPRDVQTDDMGWEQLLLPWWSFFLPLCSTVDSLQHEQIEFRTCTK